MFVGKIKFQNLYLLGFSCGFGFLGVSLSKEITNPLEASASSLSFSVLIAANISASSSVSPTPELDLNDEGPECSPEEPRRLCLKAEDKVGLCRVGDGELSFSLPLL